MPAVSSESQPLLRETASNEDLQQRYDGTSNDISVKRIDEEYLVDSSDSSTSTVNVHDPDYIVNNRLGDVSLSMIVLW